MFTGFASHEKPLIPCKWPLCRSFFADDPKGRTHKKRHEKRKHDVPLNLLRSPPPKRKPTIRGDYPTYYGTQRRRERPGQGSMRGHEITERLSTMARPLPAWTQPGEPIPVDADVRVNQAQVRVNGIFVGRVINGLFFRPPRG